MNRVQATLLALLVFAAGLGAGIAIGVGISYRAAQPVDAKTLARAIMDESRRMSGQYRDSFPSRPVESNSAARREVLFYQPGNEAIWRPLTEIPAGDGTIEGRLLVDGKPGVGIRVSIILAIGKKTVSVAVDSNGNYSIPIPRGTYNLNGFLIDDPEQKAAGRILVNLVEKRLSMFSATNKDAASRMNRQFSDLSARVGSQRAAAAMADSFSRSLESSNSFQFTVGGDTFELPPLRFNTPVQVLLPLGGGEIALNEIKFVWQTYPGATDFDVSLTRVVKNGNSTSFPSAGTARHVTKNELTLEAWRAAKKNNTEGATRAGPSRMTPGSEEDVQAGGTYSLEIIARDSEGRVLSSSRSNPHDYQSYLFRVTER